MAVAATGLRTGRLTWSDWRRWARGGYLAARFAPTRSCMHSIGLVADRSSAVDVLRSPGASIHTQVAGIVGFALLSAIGAQFRVYLWEVPFTLQTLAIYGSGLYLGWRNGLLAQLLYLAMGFLVPVYAGDGTGITYFAGAVSAGYLLGAPLSAAAAGVLSRRWRGLSGTLVAMAVASLVLFTAGVTWLHFAANHASWLESIDKGWLRFVPMDAAKILFLGLVYAATRRVR